MFKFLKEKKAGILPFVFLPKGEERMLQIKLKRVINFVVLVCIFSLVLSAGNAFAADPTTTTNGLFSNLIDTGSNIFGGMRDIVYAVSGFGIIAVAIGGFFGNLNWKWLSAIIIGLVVIALTASIINYMTDGSSAGALSSKKVQDTLKSGDDGTGRLFGKGL